MTRSSILNGPDHQQNAPLTQHQEPGADSIAVSPLPNAPERPNSWITSEKHRPGTPKDHHITYVSVNGSDQSPPRGGRHDTGNSHFGRSSILSKKGVSDFRLPRFAAPWQHETDDRAPRNPRSARRFDPQAQWRRIFVNGLSQWCITLVITLAMFGLLFGFSRLAIMGQKKKYSFNAAITILSLALGLSLVAALQNYAKILSWRFLAARYRNLQDFELIMQCDSQTKVLKLLWAGRTPGRWFPNGTQLLCLLSLSIVIGLQIVIGMLGLTYSVNTADNGAEHAFGNTSVVDLISIHQDSSYNISYDNAQEAAANYFGVGGSNADTYYDCPAGGTPELGNTIYTWDNSSWYYSFVDQDPAQTLQLNTTRYVSSTATCVQLEILSGGYINTTSVDFKNEHGQNITISPADFASITTTWMANSSSNCGPRCIQLLALNTGYNNASDPSENYTPSLFACNNTISIVQGAEKYPHNYTYELRDEQAKYIAGAIGSTGFWFAGDPLQYKDYPTGSDYSWDGAPWYTEAANVATLAMQFSTGALSAMDSIGPRVFTPGYFPRQASQLSVEWKYAIPILAIIPSVQFVLLCIVCVWANGAMIKDSSYIATARLLRPVVEKLKNHGCALTGDEIARELGNFKIIYGVRAPPSRKEGAVDTAYDPFADAGDGVDYHLGVIREDEGYGTTPEEGWCPGRKFPVGWYDGMAEGEEEMLLRSSSSSESLRDDGAEYRLQESGYDEEAAVSHEHGEDLGWSG